MVPTASNSTDLSRGQKGGCWRRSISTALRLGSGKREAALAGADKTPTKADGIVVDEPAAPPRSSGRKKVAGTLIFSDG